eukprot:6213247-Pleurochrysis_carterae.AAC.4
MISLLTTRNDLSPSNVLPTHSSKKATRSIDADTELEAAYYGTTASACRAGNAACCDRNFVHII